MTRNSSLMQCANYLIILSVCIDQGDGRWKERDKENIKHDIMVYKKIAEKLEHEIEAFYEEYPDEKLSGENIDRIHYKYLTNLLNRNIDTTKGSENKDKEKHIFSIATEASVNKESSVEKANNLKISSESFIKINESSEIISSHWPKFDDLLLAIGRKYDWKNDKWIKVKDKPKRMIVSNNMIDGRNGKLDFQDRHKFSYRIVKLNRNKSRRNVVVAVSAVR